jgi:alpha-D-xyloside xylohydrolase
MPDHEAVTAATKKLLDLRMSLIPYLYSAFNEYHLTGTPPIRAMALDWPTDKSTATIDDQFMCGPSMLVAPMFKGEPTRSVYLPAGDWYDFWTGDKQAGGQSIQVSKPLDQIPVFIKSNTLLPLAKPVEQINGDTTFQLSVRVYGDAPQPFTLYEDDGTTNDFAAGKQNQIKLSWEDGKITEFKSGEYSGPARYRIVESQQVGDAGK